MPSLIAGAFSHPGNVPVIWICSECGIIFDFGRIVLNPSVAQIEGLNARFNTHCESEHPTSAPVIGLAFPPG